MNTAHHRPRTVALAIHVDLILTKINRRTCRALRRFNACAGDFESARRAWPRYSHYMDDSLRREELLTRLAPRRMSDDELASERRRTDEACWQLSEMMAEDANEAALYGDGPCGTLARRQSYAKLQRVLAAIDDEIRKRRPAVLAAPTAADECPF